MNPEILLKLIARDLTSFVTNWPNLKNGDKLVKVKEEDLNKITSKEISKYLIPELDHVEIMQWFPVLYRLPFPGRPSQIIGEHVSEVVRMSAQVNDDFLYRSFVCELKSWTADVLCKLDRQFLLPVISTALKEDIILRDVSAYYFIILSSVLEVENEGFMESCLMKSIVDLIIQQQDGSKDQSSMALNALNALYGWLFTGYSAVCHMIRSEETRDVISKALGFDTVLRLDELPTEVQIQEYLNDISDPLSDVIREILNIGSCDVSFGAALNAYGKAVDQLIGDHPSCLPSFSGPVSDWLIALIKKYFKMIDKTLSTVFEYCNSEKGPCEDARQLILLIGNHLEASLRIVADAVSKTGKIKFPEFTTSKKEATETEVRNVFKEVWNEATRPNPLQTIIEKILNLRLSELDPNVLLGGKDSVLRNVSEVLYITDKKHFVCDECEKSFKDPNCSVCFMGSFCAQNTDYFKEIQCHLTPRDECSFLEVEQIVKCTIEDILSSKIDDMAEFINDVFDKVKQLAKLNLSPEGLEKEANRIRGLVMSNFPAMQPRIEEQLNLILQNQEKMRRETAYEIVDNSLVATGWSVSLSEALKVFNDSIKCKAIILAGIWEVILDTDLVEIPGVCLTIDTNNLVIRGTSDGAVDDGLPTCTINTSGANGESGTDGDDGTIGMSGQRGKPGGNGGNGKPGQSAGHVTINALSTNGGTVQVISIGGEGGKGGKGGNGKDGADGKQGVDGAKKAKKEDFVSKCYTSLLYTSVIYASPIDAVLPGYGGNNGKGGAPGGGGSKGKINIPRGEAYLEPIFYDGRTGERGKEGIPGKIGKGGNPGRGCIFKRWRSWLGILTEEFTEGYPGTKSVEDILGTSDYKPCGSGFWLTYGSTKCSFPNIRAPEEEEIMIDGKTQKRSEYSGSAIGTEGEAVSSADCEEISLDVLAKKSLHLEEVMTTRSSTQLNSNNVADRKSRQSLIDEIRSHVEEVSYTVHNLSLHELIGNDVKKHVNVQAHYQSEKANTLFFYDENICDGADVCWPRLSYSSIFCENEKTVEWKNYMNRVSKVQEMTDVQLIQSLEKWMSVVYSNGTLQGIAYAENIYNEFFLKTRRLLHKMAIEKILTQFFKLHNANMMTFLHEYYRALAIRHVCNACEGSELQSSELYPYERSAKRLAFERLGTCGFSKFDEQIAKSGACAFCPLDILCALNAEWGKKMKDLRCDVTDFFKNSTFGYAPSALLEKRVDDFEKKVASMIKIDPLASVWRDEKTTLLYRWLRSISPKKSSKIRNAVYSFFDLDVVVMGEKCKMHLRQNNNINNKGRVPMEALELLLFWAQILEEENSNSGMFFCRAVVNLAKCETRSVVTIPRQEKEMWREVMIYWISNTHWINRNSETKKLKEDAILRNIEETSVTAYIKSLLDTVKRVHDSKEILKKLKESKVIELVEHVCEALPSHGESSLFNRIDKGNISQCFASSKCIVPQKPCNNCTERLNNVVNEIKTANINKNEVFGTDSPFKDLADFENNAQEMIRSGNQIACLWHSVHCLSELLLQQQKEMVYLAYEKWEIPTKCKALLDKPPQNLTVEDIVCISNALVPLLKPVVPDELTESYQSIIDGIPLLRETNPVENNRITEHKLALNGKRIHAGNFEEVLKQEINPQKRHTLEILCKDLQKSAMSDIYDVLNHYSSADWIRQVTAFVLGMYLNLWSSCYFIQGEPRRIFHDFANYCEESRLLWFLSLVVKEYKQCIPHCDGTTDVQEVEQKTRAIDLQLLMEVLDGMSEVDEKWLDDKPMALIEYVTAFQQAKFDYVYSMWIKPMQLNGPQYDMKEELRGWMLAVEEPRCKQFIELVRSLSMKDVETDGPLQSFLNINDFELCPIIKLDLATCNSPHEWKDLALKQKNNNKKMMKKRRECNWNYLSKSGKFDSEKINLAKELYERLNNNHATEAEKVQFIKQYQKHAASRAEAAGFERAVFADQDRLVNVLFVICDTLKAKKLNNTNLYPVQVLSIVLLIQSGALGNIQTGQGKTFISGCCIAFKAYCGYMVDVVTSSDPLSEQSEVELRGFLEALFQKKMSSVLRAADSPSNSRSDSYKFPVVFGTMTQYVTDNLIQENIRESFSAKLADRNTCVRFMIVDEADLPLLDNFSYVVYLSSTWLAGRKVSPGLLAILHRLLNNNSNTSIEQTLRQCYLDVVQPLCKREDDSALSMDRCHIYINSAITAVKRLRDECDYVVRGKTIVPYNPGTGELQHGMSWQGGMSAFISLLHGKTCNEESLAPVFQSFFSFMVSYKGRMCGLTGTCGCWRSRRVLEDHYGLSSFNMPRAHYRAFVHEPPTARLTEDERDEAVVGLAVPKLRNQSVLIITRFPAEAQKIFERLKGRAPSDSFFLYIEGKRPQLLEDRPIIIVSTAIAGRGVDIKIPIGQNDGLFVIRTFCGSEREMLQVYGRAARQKDNGGATSIVAHPSGNYFRAQNEAIIAEKKRLEGISGRDALKISLEEELRKQYSVQYSKFIKGALKEPPAGPRDSRYTEIGALKDILDGRFGLWMSDNSDTIIRDSVSVESRRKLLNKMVKDVMDPIKDWKLEKSDVQDFLEDSEEILKFCLATKKYSSCALAKAESKCSFGSVPYLLAYTYLLEASKQRDEAKMEELFQKARICLYHAVDSFQQWEETYKYMTGVVKEVRQNSSCSDGFQALDDHRLVMEHHSNIAQRLCGTMRCDPEMFRDRMYLDQKKSKEIFTILLNKGLIEHASVVGIKEFKEKIEQSPHLEAIKKVCTVDGLCKWCASSSSKARGVDLFECLPCNCDNDQSNSESDVPNSRVQLWRLLTDEQCGAITPFVISNKYRKVSDEKLNEQLNVLFTGTTYENNGDVPIIHSAICQSIGCLRTEDLKNFTVSLKPLEKVIRSNTENQHKIVPQDVIFFEPIGLYNAIQIEKDNTQWMKDMLVRVAIVAAYLAVCYWAAPTVFFSLIKGASWVCNLVSSSLGNTASSFYDIYKYICTVGWNDINWEILLRRIATAVVQLGISIGLSYGLSNLGTLIKDKCSWLKSKLLESPFFRRLTVKLSNIEGVFYGYIDKVAAKYERACAYLKSNRVVEWIKSKLITRNPVVNSISSSVVKQVKQQVIHCVKRKMTDTSISYLSEILHTKFSTLQRELFETYLSNPLLQLCAQVKRDCAGNYDKFLEAITYFELTIDNTTAASETIKAFSNGINAFLVTATKPCIDKFLTVIQTGGDIFSYIPIKSVAGPLIEGQSKLILSRLKRHECCSSAYLNTSSPSLPSSDPCHKAVEVLIDRILKLKSANVSTAIVYTIKKLLTTIHQRSQVISQNRARKNAERSLKVKKRADKPMDSYRLTYARISYFESTQRIEAFQATSTVTKSELKVDYLNLNWRMGMQTPINMEEISLGGLQSKTFFINDDNLTSVHLKSNEEMNQKIQMMYDIKKTNVINFYTSGKKAELFAKQFTSICVKVNVKINPHVMSAAMYSPMIMYESYKRNTLSFSSKQQCSSYTSVNFKDEEKEKEEESSWWSHLVSPILTGVCDRLYDDYFVTKQKLNALTPSFISSLSERPVSELEMCCLHLSGAVYEEYDQHKDIMLDYSSTEYKHENVTVFNMSGKSGFVSKTENMKCTVFKVASTIASKRAIYVVAFKGTDITNLSEWKTNIQAMSGTETKLKENTKKNARIAVKRFGLENVIFTGHSKGGREAFIAAAETGGTGIIFNPLLPRYTDIDQICRDRRDNRETEIYNVTSFVVYKEAVSVILENFNEFKKPSKEVIAFLPEDCIFKKQNPKHKEFEQIATGLFPHTIGGMTRAMKHKCVERNEILRKAEQN